MALFHLAPSSSFQICYVYTWMSHNNPTRKPAADDIPDAFHAMPNALAASIEQAVQRKFQEGKA